MKDALLYILTHIVDHPDDITIDEETRENGIVFVIHANGEDYGKIIGKSGRIIRAIRDLIKLVATKHDTYVDVEIAENLEPKQEV